MNLSTIGYGMPKQQKPWGFGEDPMGGFGQLISKAVEGRTKQVDNEAKNALAKLIVAMQQKTSLAPPPPPVQPVGGKDLLPMMGLALLAKILGARDQDIAEGAGGFMQGRGQWAQGQNQQNQQAWQLANQGMENDRQMGIETAKLELGAAQDERSRFDAFGRENRARADERWQQEQLNKRAEMRSPEKLEYYKMLARTPEGRVQLAMAVRGNDLDAIEASRQLTEQEKLTASKTATEDAMRPGKVEEQGLNIDKKRALLPWVSKQAEANYNKTLADVAKRGADTALVNKKVLNYDEEFRLRRLNVESQILKRAISGTGGGGGKADYFGKGQEGQFNAMKSLAEAQMEKILQRGAAASGGMPTILPEDQEAFAQAKTDLDLANYAIQRTKGEKAEVGRSSIVGGGNQDRVRALADQAKSAFPGVTTEIQGPGSIPSSLHKTGQAVDFKGKNLPAVADWAITQPGVKLVIWNGRQWTPGKGWQPYKGPHDHKDHVHVDYGRSRGGNSAPATTVATSKATTQKNAAQSKKSDGWTIKAKS